MGILEDEDVTAGMGLSAVSGASWAEVAFVPRECLPRAIFS